MLFTVMCVLVGGVVVGQFNNYIGGYPGYGNYDPYGGIRGRYNLQNANVADLLQLPNRDFNAIFHR